MANIYDLDGNKIFIGEDLEDLLPGRLLVWHDEFDKPDIDTDKWSVLYGKHYSNKAWFSPDETRNIASGNGMTYFATKDSPKENIDVSGAFIHTAGKFEFRYGRLEAKMRFPDATPHHTTFWTLGTCYQVKSLGEDQIYGYGGLIPPSAGEIDIAEFDNGSVGFRTHYSDAFNSSTFLTGGNVSSLTETPTEWHVYAIEWTEHDIKSYVDGVLKQTFNTDGIEYSNSFNPFRTPHYIIFNCIAALSGEISWDVAKTNVKWVRVYAPVGTEETIVDTDLSMTSELNISVGDVEYLSPVFTPANPSDATIRWYSYNKAVATCDGGIVKGRGAGTTIVKGFSNHGCTAFCKVTVTE